MKNSYYLSNRVFLLALFTLLFNDFYLKLAYPSFLSGKLSDISGLVVFVFFFTFLFGNRFKLLIFISTALVFCWWKSSWSSGFIIGWNQFLPFYSLERAVDYTDLICLLILIPSYFYQPTIKPQFNKQWIGIPILFLGVFAIAATSKGGRDIRSYDHVTQKYIIHESFKIKKVSLADFLNYLSLSNLKFEKNPDAAPAKKPGDYHYYILRSFEIMDGVNVESMHIGVKEKGENLKVLIFDVTLYDPPAKPDKEVKKMLMELFEEFFAIGK